MKKNTLIPLLWLLLNACGGQGKPKQDNPPRQQYRTTAPSLLYFKNIRSSYYEQTEQPGTRIELYRLRKFSRPKQGSILIPVIANNWLEDEAYLFLEPFDTGPGYVAPLTIRWASESGSGTYRLQPATVDEQHQLALQLYESMMAGQQLEALAADSTWIPVYEDREERSNYIITIRDYLKLTEAL